MKIFHGGYILPFNITITKSYQIEIFNSSKYNFQWLNSNCEKICVGNGRFYLNNDGKLDLYYIFKIKYPVIKKNHQLYSLNAMKWIGIKNRRKWLVCFNIFEEHGMVLGFYKKASKWWISNMHIHRQSLNYTSIIFNKTLYHCWYK